MADEGFALVDSFGVDHGELDGLSPTECFTLGVEWQMVRCMCDDAAGGFESMIHAGNRTRLGAMLSRRGRRYAMTYLPDDRSEEWVSLRVLHPLDTRDVPGVSP